MIRAALTVIAVGIGAILALLFTVGTVRAQGVVPTAPALNICGGTRLVFAAGEDATTVNLDYAAEVLSRRIGGLYGRQYGFTHVSDAQIMLSLPVPLQFEQAEVLPLTRQAEFAFHEVEMRFVLGETPVAAGNQRILADKLDPAVQYVVNATPILDGSSIAFAKVSFDQGTHPAVVFEFTADGQQIFSAYSAENIGETFAIVLRGEVVSAPVLQSEILGRQGMITGAFSNPEAVELAAVLQGGVLPFDLDLTDIQSVDGSDPSADFCP